MADQPMPSESTVLARERTTFAHQRTDAADDRTAMAVERTLLAMERTLLAWVRTAMSLISFGFTIYKFFDYLQQAQPNLPTHAFGPREFAITMIAGGLVALVLAAVEYRRSRTVLINATGSRVHSSLALLTTVLVAGLGIGGLVLAILRQ